MQQQGKWKEGTKKRERRKKTAENSPPTTDANKRAWLYEEMNPFPEDVSRNVLQFRGWSLIGNARQLYTGSRLRVVPPAFAQKPGKGGNVLYICRPPPTTKT